MGATQAIRLCDSHAPLNSPFSAQGQESCQFGVVLVKTKQCACLVSQKLDVSVSCLRSLPDELSSLENLQELQIGLHWLSEPHISILRHLTALTYINMGADVTEQQWNSEAPVFSVPSSLLPILHPGLVVLDLRPYRYVFHDFCIGKHCDIQRIDWYEWDSLSLVHLKHAGTVLASRQPVPTLLY